MQKPNQDYELDIQLANVQKTQILAYQDVVVGHGKDKASGEGMASDDSDGGYGKVDKIGDKVTNEIRDKA